MILQSGSSQIVFKISGDHLCSRLFLHIILRFFEKTNEKCLQNGENKSLWFWPYILRVFFETFLKDLMLWSRCFEMFLLTIESELTEKTFLEFYVVGSYRSFNWFWMNLTLIWYDIILNSILIQFYVRFLITGLLILIKLIWICKYNS